MKPLQRCPSPEAETQAAQTPMRKRGGGSCSRAPAYPATRQRLYGFTPRNLRFFVISGNGAHFGSGSRKSWPWHGMHCEPKIPFPSQCVLKKVRVEWHSRSLQVSSFFRPRPRAKTPDAAQLGNCIRAARRVGPPPAAVRKPVLPILLPHISRQDTA